MSGGWGERLVERAKAYRSDAEALGHMADVDDEARTLANGQRWSVIYRTIADELDKLAKEDK